MRKSEKNVRGNNVSGTNVDNGKGDVKKKKNVNVKEDVKNVNVKEDVKKR